MEKPSFRHHSSTRFVHFLLLVVSVMALSAPNRSWGWDVTDTELSSYLQALEESRAATQDKVFRELVAITGDGDAINTKRLCGDELVWDGEPGRSRILVATFMDRTAYERFYKENLDQHQPTYLLRKSLWVTAVPELRNAFMRGCGRDRPRKAEHCPPSPNRIAKLLGLPPAKDYDVLVEFWVNPGDLFRPSADPEISDHEAEPATMDTSGLWTFASDQNPFARIDDSRLFLDHTGGAAVPFRTWYAESATRYDPANWDAPWTRLGYTYDWGNTRNHIGVSEFIVRIDPDPTKQYVEVQLVRAIDASTPEWNEYYRCRSSSSRPGVSTGKSCR